MASVWCEMVGTVGTLVQALSIKRRRNTIYRILMYICVEIGEL